MPRKRIGRRGRVGSASAGAPAQGTLSFNTTSLSFTATAGASAFTAEDPDLFVISNTGAGSLAGVQVSDNASWLTSALSTSEDGKITITVTIDPSSLTANTYNATLTVTDANASNSGATLTVSLLVNAVAPRIGLTPSTLGVTIAAGEVSGTQSVLIENTGGGTLAAPTVGTITYSGDFTGWVDSPAITDNGDDTYTLTFAAGGSALSAGTGSATIQVVSSGAANTPQVATVNLTVNASQQAVLSVTRSLDDMRATVGGSNPAAQVVGVVSANQFPLAGPVVSVTSYSGDFTGWATATLTGNTLTVTPDISGIASPGTAYFHVDVADANAANTARYSVVLAVDQVTLTPVLSVSPSALGPSVTVGSNHPSQTVTVTNANGSVAALGTVTASFPSAPTWANVSYANGTATVTYSTASLAQGTYSTTLQIAATLANNSPVSIPITLTVGAVVGGNYPIPSLAQSPAGYTWDAALGYPTGSIFNTLPSYRGADDDAFPTFGGTEYLVANQSQWNTVLTNLGNGTIVDGDIITITAGITLNPMQLPARPGWTYGTSGFVWIRTSAHASLPAYVADSGPASHGDAQRVSPTANASHVFTVSSPNTGQSALCPQAGAGGYWITGARFYQADTVGRPFYIVECTRHIGTTSSPQQVASDCPSMIVFDRCVFDSSSRGHVISLRADGRHIMARNCWMKVARDPLAPSSSTLECKGVLILNTPGPVAILGCQYGASGIGFLMGGGDPPINNVVPSDGVNMFNKIWNDPDAHLNPDGNDYKNCIEHKTGRRWIHAFNDCRYWPYHNEQLYAFVAKPVDQGSNQNSGNNYAAACDDLVFWCNRLRDVTKGLIIVIDKGDFASTANLGAQRIECGYNLKLYAQLVRPGDVYSQSLWREYAIYKSEGDGVNGVSIVHNTTEYDNAQSLINLEGSFGSAWRNVAFNYNVHAGTIRFGPVFAGPLGQDVAALNATFGAGNWDVRRNYIYQGSPAPWDAGLSGGNNQNRYIAGASVFTDTINDNYSLVSTATDASASFPGGGGAPDGRDCGYDHAYLIAMLGDRA